MIVGLVMEGKIFKSIYESRNTCKQDLNLFTGVADMLSSIINLGLGRYHENRKPSNFISRTE